MNCSNPTKQRKTKLGWTGNFLHLAKHSFARCTRSGNVRKKKKCHPFWLSSEQYIYMKERSDTKHCNTKNVTTYVPHHIVYIVYNIPYIKNSHLVTPDGVGILFQRSLVGLGSLNKYGIYQLCVRPLVKVVKWRQT